MKKVVRLSENQLVHLIKKLINEQDQPGYGKRCALGGSADNSGCDKTQMRQDRIDDKINRKEDERNAKEFERQKQQTKSQFLNPKLDAYGSKMDRTSIQTFSNDYTKFLSQNPSFQSEQNKFSPEQRFGFFKKLAFRLNKNPEWYVHEKLKSQFGHQGTITEKQLWDYSKKMGDFEKFVDFAL